MRVLKALSLLSSVSAVVASSYVNFMMHWKTIDAD